VIEALREAASKLPVSATIGDLPMHGLAAILARVEAVGACGVNYVKVGIERTPAAAAVLDALAASRWAVVPVFIADRGLDFEQVAHACAKGFPGVMVDTADKRAGSLFDALPLEDIRRFVHMVRSSGAMAGVAGALRVQHLPAVLALQPHFAGFRSAVCAADRSGDLDAELLRALAGRMHGAGEPAALSPDPSGRAECSTW
jgi:uncharacterized protein (UPF0264 family)